METTLKTAEIEGNVVELTYTPNTGDLPAYSVHSIINRKFRFELFETLESAEKYFQKTLDTFQWCVII